MENVNRSSRTQHYQEQLTHYHNLTNAEKVQEAQKELHDAAAHFQRKWVVLDDDPTGVQTVHDLPVYTDWKPDTLKQALTEPGNMFYILTNSRALTVSETTTLHQELMQNLNQASTETGIPFEIISRSDSTLRGHFPLEIDLLQEALPPADGIILAPFFQAGGRFTIGGVHYVKQGEELVPAAETEFAKDATFGYSHSNMQDYIAEKTGRPQDVVDISLETLRAGDVDAVQQALEKAQGRYVVVNALEPQDVEVFAAGLYRALNRGHHYLYRTAADFVKAVGTISDWPLLKKEDMLQNPGAGIVVVGSHTEKTTRQLEALKDLPGIDFIPFHSELVLEDRLEEEAKRVRLLAEADTQNGITPVIYTGRKVLVLPDDTKEDALRRSVAISDALVSIVGNLQETPAFVIAKGGITSSDVGVKALRVKRAWVLGQVMPGIPVWQCGDESRFPGVPYIIFPGNVGEENTLRLIVQELTR